ncbi:hypothetical protein [Glaciibacter superstes]|uniref:hypothetical protein n=1 Tax=Glaciibacter superstes TaxID=501023 RepID=UPI0012FC5150|nr:hypothetical protein [Glaciibacter superstes]
MLDMLVEYCGDFSNDARGICGSATVDESFEKGKRRDLKCEPILEALVIAKIEVHLAGEALFELEPKVIRQGHF